jgi:hypothetical protein
LKRYKFISFLFLITLPFVYSQQDNEGRYITIIPGEQFAASGFYKVWFGEHWREVWTTPVRVEILNLNEFAEGLTPIQKGGGMQTKSLRFKGNDGKIWKFRSIEKDPSKVLPEELRESIAEDIVQDQISSANPFAPLVVSPLLDAVGILEAEPKLVFLPEDENLAEYKSEFGGVLGFIEEHPSEGEDDQAGFEDAIDVKGTYKLFDYLAKKRNQKIESQLYLKARLIDMLVGDWDRHMDQWRWAKFDSTARGTNFKVWKPIPRDRDQAFTKYDGVFPFTAAYIVPQLNNFGKDYPQIEDLTWNGRFLDRRVLTELSKTTWDSLTAFVKLKITDEVINTAIKRLPPEIYPLCSEELSSKLKLRRDNLQLASDEFYGLVNKYADVFCSDEDDYIEVNRLDDKSTNVSIFKRNKSTGNGKGEPLFYKTFDNDITVDIRIHMNKGDDKAFVFGESSYGPVVRIIGGKGKDEFIDESIVEGYFLSVTPFQTAENRTYFYDSGDKTEVTEGPGTVYDDSKWPEPNDDQEKYEPTQRDRGHDWLPIPIIDYNTDYDFTIGGGIQLNRYNFREVPKEYMQQITLSYATRFGNFAAASEADFYSLIRNSRLNILVAVTQQFVIRYFGYGNETSFDKNLESENYYQVNQNLVTFFPTLYYNFSKKIFGSIGISFIQTKTSLNNDTLLTGFKYGDYGLGVLKPFGIHLGLEIDGKDHPQYPLNGYWMNFYGKIFPDVYDIPETFYFAGFDLRTYLTSELISFATLALRAGGSKVFSQYPFYAGATVGGQNSLRGYNDARFSGDAALFGQAELRLFITKLNLIFKSKVGINLFIETGRVFTENDNSDKWHPSYGVGLWVAYLNSTLIGTTYVAFSPERTTFNMGFGMGF